MKRAKKTSSLSISSPAFLFDLDGTLVDSVYQHVLAWREALEGAGIELLRCHPCAALPELIRRGRRMPA